MRREVRAERDRQSHHELMQLGQRLIDRLGIDPAVLHVPLTRDFDTRRTLEQEAFVALLRQVDAKLDEAEKPVSKRKEA